MSVVHFLNVGHGDCTVIEHDSGRVTVIDLNNCESLDETTESEIVKGMSIREVAAFIASRQFGLSDRVALEKAGYSIPLTNPVEFLAKRLGGKSIFRYVQTHPDMDHMRGLSIVRNQFEIVNFWDTKNTKKLDSFTSDSDRDDWKAYKALGSGSYPTVLRLYRGATGVYFTEGKIAGDLGDGLHVLSPTKVLLSDADDAGNWNRMSYVIMLIEHGKRIVLGADADPETWADIFEAYGKNLKCDVLKAAHHGRESGYHEDAVKAMAPGLTVVSVGKKPDQDASDSYRLHSNHVWSTRWKGDVTVRISSDGTMTAESRCDNKPLTWKQAAA